MIDMTKGKPLAHLIKYAVPLLLGNLMQLMYNAVDSIIAGRFIGQDALAAEGIAEPVMNMIILLISGVTIGSGVLMSEAYGAKNMDKLRKLNGVTLVLGAIAGSIVGILGFFLSKYILILMDTPSVILDKTTWYLSITFLGVPFVFIFNALSAGLKSVGDSRTPLLFLAFSSILNAALDLIFLGLLGFGIICSATTTVVAEIVSAFLALWWTKTRNKEIFPKKKDLALEKESVLSIVKYGGPTALQQMVQPLGKLFIQSAVNSLGVASIAAFNASARVDSFALIPEQGIASAEATYIAQNRGAEKKERVMKGFWSGVLLELSYALIIGVVVFFLKDGIVSLFIDGENAGSVIERGASYLGVMAFLYALPSMTNLVQGFFRGTGKMYTTIMGTTVQITIRTIFTFILTPKMGIIGIAYASGLGWAAMLLWELPYLFITAHKRGYKIRGN
ncbi:MAG: MATE family efflux transporter [Spirochaetales bacterium]|nr:MATE family efflux transporter [Spirochaetales bacterium]